MEVIIGQICYPGHVHAHTHTHTHTHTELSSVEKDITRDFLGDSVVKNLPAHAVDTGLIPDPGRSQLPWSK